ncbi:MAG TPA: AAA family ATPase, partial [Noviherbaspirillum sp.]|nr:AAA family ATPase [Noviherbaspirillum sp.]
MTAIKRQDKGALSLLGGWQLTMANGQVISFPAHEKGRALLAYLATENRWHYRETLGDLLWPDSPSPRANLRQALSVLRGVLNDDSASHPCLQMQRNAVRFSPNGEFLPDVAGFTDPAPACNSHLPSGQCPKCTEHMEQTAARYKGEFMAGFSLPDCPEFEAWLQLKRETFRLHELHLLGRLADWHATNGAPDAALIHARRYVELEPWDESGQRRLMKFYAAAGNTVAALKQFEAYSKELDAELGATPDESTRALYEHLHAAGCQEAKPLIPTMPPMPLMPAQSAASPERLQVTVLYCELSTAESDPEDLVAMLRAPTQHAIEIIRRNGGYHVENHSAGLLAYFGYPRPMEDAAVLAARTAVAISRATTEPISAPVSVRFGLHTGLIVTGDNAAVPDVAGQMSGLAIQLCQLSAPGQIHLSGATHALVSGYFRCQPIDTPSFSRINGTSKAFLLQEETGAVMRLDAAARLTPLVGRMDELARLEAIWHQPGVRAVLLRGDPGIGKSRLVRHFKKLIRTQPAMVREVYCRPEYQSSAFHPLCEYLTKASNFTSADDDETKLDKLERYLSDRYPSLVQQLVPLLARLLAIPSEHRYAAPALPPQQEKEAVLSLMLQMLLLAAKEAPLLLIAEDLHWADPSTLDLLQRILDENSKTPICLLLTARPEFQPDWQGKITLIDLPPLSGKEAATLIGLVNTEQRFPATMVARIVAATDGVPLFIEETTRMFMTKEGSQPTDAAIIPATLRDLLAARLDRLSEAKRLVQICAVIGREFDSDLLHAVTPLSEDDTARALHELEESGLINRMAASDVPTYQFRHALIQEAAYQSQARSARREAHRSIARALKAQAAQWIRAPEVLAQHFYEAGDACEAIEWWHKAGTSAAGRGAVTEATQHFNRAL